MSHLELRDAYELTDQQAEIIQRGAVEARESQAGGSHYTAMSIQPWDVIDTWPVEQRIGYYRGCSLKYLMRMGAKDESAQEIAKGRHCMAKLIEVLTEPLR